MRGLVSRSQYPDELFRKEWFRPLFGPGSNRVGLATEEQLQVFEEEFYPIPQEYRWFLKTLGGGGVDHMDGIDKLPATHRRFNSHDWNLENVFVIGWDDGGNPFGIERETGRILAQDQQFPGVYLEAPSLLAFLLEQIYGDPFDDSWHNWDEERIAKFECTGDAAPKGGWPNRLRILFERFIAKSVVRLLEDKEHQ